MAFIRQKANGYYYLVENKRNGKRNIQKVLQYLGKRDSEKAIAAFQRYPRKGFKGQSTTVEIQPPNSQPAGLVDIGGLIGALWPDRTTAPCETTILRMVRRNSIPCVRIGRLIYFDPSAVFKSLTK